MRDASTEKAQRSFCLPACDPIYLCHSCIKLTSHQLRAREGKRCAERCKHSHLPSPPRSVVVVSFGAGVQRLLALEAEPKQRGRHNQHGPDGGVERAQQLRLEPEEQQLGGTGGGAPGDGACGGAEVGTHLGSIGDEGAALQQRGGHTGAAAALEGRTLGAGGRGLGAAAVLRLHVNGAASRHCVAWTRRVRDGGEWRRRGATAGLLTLASLSTFWPPPAALSFV